jgi:hypothetical protein
MKTASFKAAALVASLLASESAGFSQGYVLFSNDTSSRVSTNTFPGGPLLGVLAAAPPGSYYYELLVAPTTQTTINGSLTGWTDTGVTGTNTSLAGRMAGPTSSDSLLGVQIPGYGPATTANFAVLGWSSSAGTNFSQALAVWNNGSPNGQPWVTGPFLMGLSTVASNVQLAPAGGPYNNVWGASAVGLIQGMVLYPTTPEPSSLALVGLGALVFLRRRK